MRYITAKTKYILVCITLSPKKADGNRDTIEVQEIAKADNRGVLEYLNNSLYHERDKDNRRTATAKDFILMYNVITVQEAKKYKEARV